MAKYQKIDMLKIDGPGVVVEATQWFKNGDHPEDYAEVHDEVLFSRSFLWGHGQDVRLLPAERKRLDLEGDVVRRYSGVQRTCEKCGRTMREHGIVHTVVGLLNVCPGDWIVKVKHRTFYPYKPDTFAATYEPIEEQANG